MPAIRLGKNFELYTENSFSEQVQKKPTPRFSEAHGPCDPLKTECTLHNLVLSLHSRSAMICLQSCMPTIASVAQ